MGGALSGAGSANAWNIISTGWSGASIRNVGCGRSSISQANSAACRAADASIGK